MVPAACLALTLAACHPNTEVAYQPPLIPVTFSIDSDWHVSISIGAEITTFLGRFSVQSGVSTAPQSGSTRVLIVDSGNGTEQAYDIGEHGMMTLCLNGQFQELVSSDTIKVDPLSPPSQVSLLPGNTTCPSLASATPVASAAPLDTSAPQQGSGTSLTSDEEQLVNKLDSNYFTNCIGRPNLEGYGVVAAVNCQSVDSGPTRQPLVVQFSGIDAARAWFRDNTAGFFGRGSCAAGRRLGYWSHDNSYTGAIGCSYTPDGEFRIVWTIDRALIGVIADGSDGYAMNYWWSNSAYAISCGC
jgi:hypothetical protein